MDKKIFETSIEYINEFKPSSISLMNVATEDQLRDEVAGLQREMRILWECIKELKKGEQQ